MKSKFYRAALLIALVLCLAATGCSIFMGKDGSVTGAIWWPSGYGMVANFSGSPFPSVVTKSVQYPQTAGTWYFYYYLYDSYYYYTQYKVTYTVTVNKGKLFSDGEDKAFTIYCYTNGATASGLNTVGPAPKAVNGESLSTYTAGALSVTVKTEKVDSVPGAMLKQKE